MNSVLIDGLLEAGWLPPIVVTDKPGPDTLMPIGKRMKDCFGWELEAIGRFFSEVGAVGQGDDELVGNTLTDYQLRAMLWRIVAEAEKATRS
jgi:hypothetical protein